mmetsp:Transcript_42334/g.79296  ORF Transcript_42334/g.79296 Transcript_42334/m.79296 type:complete len:421 (-) Transcript_42334:49-1311(-)
MPDSSDLAAQLMEAERRVREWVESSFSPKQDERLKDKGHLRARFNVSLTPQLEQQLKLVLTMQVGPLLQTEFKVYSKEDKEPRRCLEVVLTKAARTEYGAKHPEVAAQLEVDVEEETEAAGDAEKTISPKKSPEKRPASEILQEAAGLAKRFRPKSVWEEMLPHVVPAGPEGLKAAKQVLEAGWSAQQSGLEDDRKAEMEAVAWLKGLEKCKVDKESLKESLIGQVLNPWRKHPEPYVANLAASLMHAWKEAYRNAALLKKQEEEQAAAAAKAEEAAAKHAGKGGKGKGKGRPGGGGGGGGAKKEPKESAEDKEARAHLPPTVPPDKVRMELQKVLAETDLNSTTVGILRGQLEVNLGLSEGSLATEELRPWVGLVIQTEIQKFVKQMKKKQKAEQKAAEAAEAAEEKAAEAPAEGQSEN